MMSYSFTDEQLEYIEQRFNSSYSEKVIENIAKLKSFIPEAKVKLIYELNDDDRYASVWDVSKNEADTKVYTCVCGRKLKKEYVLSHKYKEIQFSLGQTHYKEYCQLTGSRMDSIVNDNQILLKIKDEFANKLKLGINTKELIMKEIDIIPKEYREQLEVGLPLLDKQRIKLYESNLTSKVLKRIDKLSKDELEDFFSPNQNVKAALLIRLKNGREVTDLSEVKDLHYGDIKDKQVKLFEANVDDEIENVNNDKGQSSQSLTERIKEIEKRTTRRNANKHLVMDPITVIQDERCLIDNPNPFERIMINPSNCNDDFHYMNAYRKKAFDVSTDKSHSVKFGERSSLKKVEFGYKTIVEDDKGFLWRKCIICNNWSPTYGYKIAERRCICLCKGSRNTRRCIEKVKKQDI